MNTRLLLSLCLAALLASCGGGDNSTPPVVPPPVAPPPAAPLVAPTHLSYSDPTGNGWRLVKDASSTDTRIVLNLVGPGGLLVRGVGFNLKRGMGLAFSTFATGGYANDTGVLRLKGTNANVEPFAGTAADPVLFTSVPLKSGDVLSTGIFQKDRANAAKPTTAPLVQVAVTLADLSKVSAATVAAAADPYGVHVIKARIVPDDIGGMDGITTTEVIAKARMLDIQIAAGTIAATP